MEETVVDDDKVIASAVHFRKLDDEWSRHGRWESV
jgi:hypothetical protein